MRSERGGRRLHDAGLATRIVRALTHPARSRIVLARVERVAPRVSDDRGSLGTAASQGCIRMAIPDVEELYERVPEHAPIYIA